MKKPSEVFKNIRFAKLDPTHDKGPKGSTDDEEHGAVSEIEWDQQLQHVKKRAMQEKVDKPTGELKDACWKGYTAVGMKMKDGKKVPNCVPTNEGTDMKAARIIKDLYKKKGVSDKDKWSAEYKKARAAGSSSANAKARANGAVYEEEQIDELSKETLTSYRVKSIGRDSNFEKQGYAAAKGSAGNDKSDKLFNKADAVSHARKRAQEKLREEETLDEGRMKDIATNKAEDERLKSKSWKVETPWMKSKETVTDKSGAKHTPMSRARDLARAAAKKNVKESVSITESRLADIVREAAEKAKKKKKEETKKSDDTFQPDPELSTQIIRND